MSAIYFPELYPEETVHSLVARHRHHTGGKDIRVTMEVLFGAPEKNMSVEMPSRLNELASRSGRGLDPIVLAARHTSLRYYAAYKGDVRKRAALEQMLGDGAPAAVLGQSASPNFSKSTLHHCAACRDEMVERYGEPYWRREHQLPSVLICPIHGTPLIDSRISRNSRIKAVVPAVFCPGDAAEIEVEGFAVPTLRRLARRSTELLCRDRKKSKQDDRASLEALLRRKGFVLRNGTIDITDITKVLHSYFEMLRPYWPALAYSIDDDRSWLHFVHGSKFTSAHTIKHLLLRDALIQLRYERSVPKRHDGDGLFGTGPWPCLNRLADHFGEPTISRVERYYGTHQHEGGRFTCECGYVYVRLKRRTGEFGPPKRKTFGPLMEDLVVRATSAGWSLNRTAKHVGMNADSLFIYLERHGIKHPWANDRLMQLPVRRPDSRRSNVPALPSRRPRSKGRNEGYSNSDLRRIDIGVSKRIQEVAKGIRQRRPEQRVSRNRLQRELSFYSRLSPERIPLITTAFDECCETTESFRRRRLFNILDDIGDNPRPTFSQLASLCYNSTGLAARWVERMVAEYDRSKAGKSENES